MAKRELSSTLKNLKFMQRAVQKEEKAKKEEDDVIHDGNGNPSSSNIQIRKCIVIMEGNPHPGAVKGRMSFQSFNPSIDKLNEGAENPDQPKVSSANTGDANNFERENGSSCIGPDCSNGFKAESEYNGDLKRKNPESVTEVLYPNKSPKTASREGDQRSSPNNRNGSYKQKKREKLDFNVLRRPNVENRKA